MVRPKALGFPLWALPHPLRYSGAHTHRLSGDWGLNAQNWPRYTMYDDKPKETGLLRRAHKAPPGYVVVKRDASQIEARVVAWLAGQNDLLLGFATGEDIYSQFAQDEIYHYPVNKTTVDERFVGKSAILGLGFGVGAPKFVSDVAAKSYVNLGTRSSWTSPKGVTSSTLTARSIRKSLRRGASCRT
jgi:hypothetical protein